jgi:hypothetical protein
MFMDQQLSEQPQTTSVSQWWIFTMAQRYQWYSARLSAETNCVCCVYQRFTGLCWFEGIHVCWRHKIIRTIAHQSDIQTVQNDINDLFNWSEKWLLRFQPDKCKVLPITRKHSSNRENERYQIPTYEGSITTLVTVNCEKDVGVNIDSNLKFDQHIQTKVNQANQIVALIRRSFRYLDFKTFRLLLKALVRPHVAHAGCIWNPYLKKDIEAIENVQRRATKMLPYSIWKNYHTTKDWSA